MASYLNDKATFFGSATTTGQLFVIDHYPGMVYHPDSTDLVYGDLYGFNDPLLLQTLDEFEEVEISDEFSRHEIVVNIDNKM